MGTERHIFITGITGSLGSALAPLYLNEANTYMYALIRAKSQEHLQQRVDQLFDFWGDDIKAQDARARFIPVQGDAAENHLGLRAEHYHELAQKITHIIHSAATIKLNMEEGEAIKKVLTPTRQILAFAQACRNNGHFKKLEYVSTVGVAGRMRGLVPETALPHVQDFHNNYERFKSQAESLVLQMVEEGLPATLHRPSMVIGDSRTGKIIHFQGFYFLCDFLSGKMTGGLLPRFPDVRLDLIPADEVAQAIYCSSQTDSSIGRIFHLCAGPERAVPISDFVTLVHQHFKPSMRLAPIRYLPSKLFLTMLSFARFFVGKPLKKAISNLSLFADYLEDRQLFDNTQTLTFFRAWNVPASKPQDYLTRVFAYYLKNR